jgi:hypothetical protein
MDENSNASLQSTNDTFIALVDAIIPRTPILAQIYGEIMYYGALDLDIDEYVIMNLNFATFPLARLTSELLNLAARQYLLEEGTKRTEVRYDYRYNNRNSSRKLQEASIFQELDRRDRFRAISLLEENESFFSNDVLFYEYPSLLTTVGSLNRLTVLGYYSEWFGYGATKLNSPDERIFQFEPLSWEQVSYPGPSLGYISEVREYYSKKNKE